MPAGLQYTLVVTLALRLCLADTSVNNHHASAHIAVHSLLHTSRKYGSLCSALAACSNALQQHSKSCRRPHKAPQVRMLPWGKQDLAADSSMLLQEPSYRSTANGLLKHSKRCGLYLKCACYTCIKPKRKTEPSRMNDTGAP